LIVKKKNFKNALLPNIILINIILCFYSIIFVFFFYKQTTIMLLHSTSYLFNQKINNFFSIKCKFCFGGISDRKKKS